MKRNYIKELKQSGYSYAKIAKETHISKQKISAIARGLRPLPKSKDADYEKIRNTNRRLAYQHMRATGTPAKAASKYRREHLNPIVETKEFESTKLVKHKQSTTRYQLRLVGDWYNQKINEWRYAVESFSFAHLEIDNDLMFQEAIQEGRGKLGGTNWELMKVIEKEMMEYILSDKIDNFTEKDIEP